MHHTNSIFPSMNSIIVCEALQTWKVPFIRHIRRGFLLNNFSHLRWERLGWMHWTMQRIHRRSVLDGFYNTHLDLTSVIRLAHLKEKGLLSCMNIAMHAQDRFLSEALSTVTAFIGFISGVNCLVFIEIGPVSECLSTFCTHVRFLSRVNSLMYFEMWFLGEGLLTLRTFIRLLCGMNSLMCN